MTNRSPTVVLQERLGYQFADEALLTQALTHRSAVSERLAGASYERMEFLGDAVLGLVSTTWLFETRPDEPEGELTRLKSRLVSATALAAHAEHMGVGDCLLLGHGEEHSGGRLKHSLLADAMEAVLGAVYLDGGLEAAASVIHELLEASPLDGEDAGVPLVEAKNELQELLQGRGLPLPIYSVLRESGPDHEKSFEVEVSQEGRVLGIGRGKSKKAAEQEAALVALASLEDDVQPPPRC